MLSSIRLSLLLALMMSLVCQKLSQKGKKNSCCVADVAAIADAVLYRMGKQETVCYACDAVHRGFRPVPRHPRFDRTIAERLKFGKSAVMGSPMRDGGTAGAPDPEH